MAPGYHHELGGRVQLALLPRLSQHQAIANGPGGAATTSVVKEKAVTKVAAHHSLPPLSTSKPNMRLNWGLTGLEQLLGWQGGDSVAVGM